MKKFEKTEPNIVFVIAFLCVSMVSDEWECINNITLLSELVSQALETPSNIFFVLH